MRMQVRRNYFAGGLAALTAAAVSVFALPTGSQAFTPVTYGLTLPETVSAAQPVRIVTTSRDLNGRPVFRVRVATDKAEAAQLIAQARQAGGTLHVELDVRGHALEAPTIDDEHAVHQWDLGKLGVEEAWQSSTGEGVTVAVIDSGVDAGHPDLADNMVAGYDAIEDTDGGDFDDNGHGTHVAGTIAAVTGNGVGIAGIAPHARIMPIKVLDAEGSGYMSDTAEGIVWATDKGAQVINLSLGSADQVDAVSEAIAYAREQGVTVIAAAGNERANGSPVNFPAADEGVIAVAATDDQDEVAEFSNEGDYLDVAAPGAGIMSTVPDGGYEEYSGTSMASPHVAGVAALLVAYRPDLGPDDVEEVLESTAVDLGEEGFDTDYGNGRIDARAAVESLDGDGGEDGGDGEVIVPEVLVDIESKTVGYGTKTSTTFVVSDSATGDPLSGHVVERCVTTGSYEKCEDVKTDEDGEYTLVHVAKSSFVAELTVPESEETEEASASSAYTVRAVVTASKAGKGSLTVKVGGASGQKLTLQRQVKGKWSAVKTYAAKPSQKISGLASGAYRVVLASSKSVEGVTSGTVKL
ncbi:S8 family peptidase [Actinoplanes sp. NPDC049802]|uniref:S8 family peptidase n=1 Tax=Actinoplanes sp. NPDC049802 TaxID=3154742 RepID=UPI0033FB24FD